MTIAVGNIDNLLPGVWGDSPNYPPGALREAYNVMLEGNQARSRYGTVPLMGMTSVPGGANVWGTAATPNGPIVVYTVNGSSSTTPRAAGRRNTTLYTNAPSVPSGVSSVIAARGMVNPPGAPPGIIVAAPSTGVNPSATVGVLHRTLKPNSAWMYFDRPAQPGTYTIRVQFQGGGQVTATVTFADPAAITENPVDMSGIPIMIGTGDNARANPEYQAIYNQRSTAAQADAIRRRAAAVQALQPRQAALKVLQAFQALSTHTQQPNQDGKLYCQIGGNDLLHFHNPLSCRILEAPAWVTILNPGMGTKENLPAIGHPGQSAVLADGLRYRYSTEDGWTEVPGDSMSGGFMFWGWRLANNGLSHTSTPLKFNLGRKGHYNVGVPVTAHQDGTRTVIHCKNGILVSTAVDPYLYGPVSRNSTSPADGWIYAQSATILSVAPGGEGVYFSDDDGTVYLHRYGSGAVTRLYKGPDSHVALFRGWLYMVSREGRVSRLRRGSDGEVDTQPVDHIHIDATIDTCVSCAFGVLVSCNQKDTGYRVFYLIQDTGDTASLWGPMAFPPGTAQPLPGGVAGVCNYLYSGVHSSSTDGVEFYRWGFAGDPLLDLDLQKSFVAPGSVTESAHIRGSLKMKANSIPEGQTEWGYWPHPGTNITGTFQVGMPVHSYVDILPPLPGHIQTPAEGVTLQTFTVRDPHPSSYAVKLTPLYRTRDGEIKEGLYRAWFPDTSEGPYGPPVRREVTHTMTRRNLLAIRLSAPEVSRAPAVFRSGRYKYTVKVWGNRVTSAWSTGR